MPDAADRVLRDYYEARAPVYDAVYTGVAPPWVADMVAALADTLRGRRVLEVACGTGHWTRHAATAAAAITAVDASPAMLAIAAAKLADRPHVTVARADAYTMDGVGGGVHRRAGDAVALARAAARRDGFFRAWQSRPSYLIVKNYFTEAQLRDIVAPHGEDVTVTMGDWWWWLSYRVR